MTNDISSLKSAYELASERILHNPNKKFDYDEENIFGDLSGSSLEDKKWDFVDIPEFSAKKDVVIESDSKKTIETETEPNGNPPIRVVKSKTYHYGDKMLELYWNGQFLDYGGFARMNRSMVFGLSNRNVKVKTEIQPFLTHVNQATQKEIESLSRNVISEDAPRVYGVTVPSYVTGPGRKIIYTMIESCEKAHKDYIGKLNLADEIWTPTEYGKKVLENSGLNIPIYVMPLGVDTSRYTDKRYNFDFLNVSDESAEYLNNSFVFLSVFRWSYRKGYDILLKAFMEEFGPEDNVSLLMASRAVECSEDSSSQKISEDFTGIRSMISKNDEDLPYVALYTEPIHEKNMPNLYGASDAFVLISRGEGFCMPMIEAGACGIPVIGSNVTGQTDFLNQENSFLVEPDGYVKAECNGQLSNMAKLCHFYNGQIFPDFNTTSIEKTKEHMRFIYENYEEAKKKAMKLHEKINVNYTWDMAVDRVYDRIRKINKK